MFVCIIGNPLSGKSVLAGRLAGHLHWPVFETGKFARSCTPPLQQQIGREDRFEYAEEAIRKELALKFGSDLIIDGFPRSVAQMEFLVEHGVNFWVFFLMINPVLQYQRMGSRADRGDDTVNKVAYRTIASRNLWKSLNEFCTGEEITTMMKVCADDPFLAYEKIKETLNV